MKKILSLSVIVATITINACAQRIDAAKVPTSVKATFEKQYPDVRAKWEMEKGNYEAGFVINGSATSILITPDGAITETETDIKVNTLPTTVLDYLKKNYSGKKVNEAAKISTASGTVTYEAEVNGKDLIFDADGKFIKEIKD